MLNLELLKQEQKVTTKKNLAKLERKYRVFILLLLSI
jgi:hypothetical protein